MNDTKVSSAQDGAAPRWLLLVAALPSKPDYLRVKLQRRVRRVGALPLRGAVYVLPNRDDTTEDFVWLRLELLADGGEATVFSASALAGVTDAELEAMFRGARDADYREIADAARALAPDDDEAARARLRRRLEEVRQVDFFDAPARAEAERALEALAAPPAAAASEAPPAGRVWVTRAGVFVDRIASAWLIRRFIDPAATFRFVAPAEPADVPRPGELRFDMYDGEYTHEGDRCTFETLLARFGLTAPGLAAVAEIVHDIDCKDGKFGRPEAPGIASLLAGLARAAPDDAARVERGAAIFDALLAQLGPRA